MSIQLNAMAVIIDFKGYIIELISSCCRLFGARDMDVHYLISKMYSPEFMQERDIHYCRYVEIDEIYSVAWDTVTFCKVVQQQVFFY